jgi:hypothetical protein
LSYHALEVLQGKRSMGYFHKEKAVFIPERAYRTE